MSQEEIEQAVGPELRRLVAPPAPPKPEESGFLRQAADIPVTVAKAQPLAFVRLRIYLAQTILYLVGSGALRIT